MFYQLILGMKGLLRMQPAAPQCFDANNKRQ